MSNVHRILKNRFSSNMRIVGNTPWYGNDPLGCWLKDDRVIPFSVLANMVSSGGAHVGKSTAERLKLEGDDNIVPMKITGDIDLSSGNKRSYWKFVPAVRVDTGTFKETKSLKVIKAMLKKLGFNSNVKSAEEAFSSAFFGFMNKVGGENHLQLESFISEVASAYLLLNAGLRVPEYQDSMRKAYWTKILNQNNSDEEQRFITNVGTRADSLIRPALQ